MSILKNSFLHLVSFKVQYRSAAGRWYRSDDLRPGRDYRWRFQLQNRHAPHLTDWASIDYVWLAVYSGPHPHYEYYSSDSYAGQPSSRFEIRETQVEPLRRDQKRVFHQHFRWNGPLLVVDGLQPSMLPSIAIDGTEQRACPNPTPVPIRPNVG